MKSAYELAMERLSSQEPTRKVSDALKKILAEIDTTYQAKIAERETFSSRCALSVIFRKRPVPSLSYSPTPHEFLADPLPVLPLKCLPPPPLRLCELL